MGKLVLFSFFFIGGCGDDVSEETCDTPPCAQTTSTTTMTTTTTSASTTSSTTTEETASSTTTVQGTDWSDVLVVNEFMADNISTIADGNGIYSDWIELYNLTKETVSLDGFWISDDLEEPEMYELTGLTIDPEGFLMLWADGKGKSGPEYLPFKLDDNGEEVGFYSPEGDPIDQLIFGPQTDNLAAARVPDGSSTWQYVYGGTPGYSNIPLVLVEEEIVSAGSTWSYLDADQSEPKGWEAPGFDDSAWPAGPAPLGYGDDFIVTEVSYGSNSSEKAITIYYRMTVEFTKSVELITASIGFMADDGGIVYLNGVEVVRENMPKGKVNEETVSTTTTSTENVFGNWDIDTGLIVDGLNTIAVEVHQAGPTSSDTSFDLTLSVSTVKLEE